MPVPKRKQSRSRRDSRSANKGLTFTFATKCQTSQDVCIPHAVCLTSGYYKGRKILRTKAERQHEREQARAGIKSKREASAAAKEGSSFDVQSEDATVVKSAN